MKRFVRVLIGFLLTAPVMALATVTADMNVDIRVTESQVKDLGTARINHVWGSVKHLLSGTTLGKIDRVWSDQRALASTSETLDLSGSLTSELDGSTVSFDGGVVVIVIENTATGTGLNLAVGGAAATQFVGYVGDATDIVVIPPGGFMIWYAGNVDDRTAGNGVADSLKINSASGTVIFNILIAGRSTS